MCAECDRHDIARRGDHNGDHHGDHHGDFDGLSRVSRRVKHGNKHPSEEVVVVTDAPCRKQWANPCEAARFRCGWGDCGYQGYAGCGCGVKYHAEYVSCPPGTYGPNGYVSLGYNGLPVRAGVPAGPPGCGYRYGYGYP